MKNGVFRSSVKSLSQVCAPDERLHLYLSLICLWRILTRYLLETIVFNNTELCKKKKMSFWIPSKEHTFLLYSNFIILYYFKQ